MSKYRGKKVLIVGFGKSGAAVARFMAKQGARIMVTDIKQRSELSESIEACSKLKLHFDLGRHTPRYFTEAEVIVVSPGVPKDLSPLKEAKEKGIAITTEVELAVTYLNEPLIAVTGSMGKTTTAILLNKIFEHSGFLTYLGGSCGTPLLDHVTEGNKVDFVIAEFSSTELELIENMVPSVAIFTNISKIQPKEYPDIESYIATMRKLLQNCNRSTYVILNKDNPLTVKFKEISPGQVFWISKNPPMPAVVVKMEKPEYVMPSIQENREQTPSLYMSPAPTITPHGAVQAQQIGVGGESFGSQTVESEQRSFDAANSPVLAPAPAPKPYTVSSTILPPPVKEISEKFLGVYSIEDKKQLVVSIEDKDEIYDISKARIFGAHNRENLMNAICTARLLGVDPEKIQKSISKIEGVPHRLEFIRRKNGVYFFNDSKSTDVGSIQKSLSAFKSNPIILISGGKDKNEDFEILEELIKKKCKTLILLGEAKEKINRAIGDFAETYLVGTFEEAVLLSYQKARTGDIVLLSPGCASNDMFRNHEERGDYFKKLVQQI